MKALPVLDSKAAGIDVGSEKLHVSIAGDTPKVFGTFTGDLERLRDWFQEQGVHSVAMEATGVYWLYVYEVLEAAGLEVVVVNGRHVQNVPGRKTDMADCQWLATLHAHGLLRGGFVPPADIRQLQDYQRLRADHLIGRGQPGAEDAAGPRTHEPQVPRCHQRPRRRERTQSGAGDPAG
jgi:hypothetical protein